MDIVSRQEWGAAPARAVAYTTWAKRTGWMLHYSAASPDQTPRAIQDYHMRSRGWSDIGYNFLVHSRTGTIYEGRGWRVIGAHCAGYNTANIGVCVIGGDRADVQDVSDAARASLRWHYAEAQRRAGHQLVSLGHRDRGTTACPGDELYGWLRAGMPGTPVPAPAPDNWERTAIMALDTLRIGQRGPDVRKSQGLLAAAGFPPAHSFRSDGTPDGIAGTGWLSAVRGFQARREIGVDGVVGPQTWGELLR